MPFNNTYPNDVAPICLGEEQAAAADAAAGIQYAILLGNLGSCSHDSILIFERLTQRASVRIPKAEVHGSLRSQVPEQCIVNFSLRVVGIYSLFCIGVDHGTYCTSCLQRQAVYHEYMIATLTGDIAEKLVDSLVVDVCGVGYGLRVTAEDYGTLATGTKAKIYVYEHIREQAHDLYGFLKRDTQNLFEQLLEVKNVGPKVAMAVLDIGTATAVRAAIASGDVRLLQTAKGVGKRAAEQIVVELRDKVGVAAGAAAEDVVTRPGVNTGDEAVEALISLGYSPQDAMLALRGIDSGLSTEERVTLALKNR